MRTRRYARALVRRAWVPLLLMSVTVLGTGTLTLLSKPTYAATATVVANTPPDAANRTLSFTDVVGANTLLTGVIRSLDLPDSPDALGRHVTVTNDRSSTLYHITVTDSDPQRATAIANAVAREAVRLYMQLGSGSSQAPAADTSAQESDYLEQYQRAVQALVVFQQQHPSANASGDATVQSEYMRRQLDVTAAANAYQNFRSGLIQAQVNQIEGARNFDAQVVDPAVARPDTPSRLLRVAYAAVLSLAVGIAAVFVLEHLDGSLREVEDVEQLVGAPVLGIIAHAEAGALRPRGGDA
ncbi:MAG TPA: hypothetical protein VLW53_03610 [Candidatus Eisenbacteria bacterium]|nr:hypothetical protein [Candidatus Eisenbacteria bacterium]